MDEPRDHHIEWNKSDRKGEVMYESFYVWNLKTNDTNELTKQKEIHRLGEQTRLQEWRMDGRDS